MRKLRLSIFVSVLLVGTIIARAFAAQESNEPKSANAPHGRSLARLTPAMQILLARINTDITRARYFESLAPEFSQLDANSDGVLNQLDIDLHEAMAMRQARTSSVSRTMRMDLDGDGYVTEDEVRTIMRYDLRTQLGTSSDGRYSQRLISTLQQIERAIRALAELDVNKDGKVSYPEAVKLRGNFQGGLGDGGLAARVKQALTLADDGSTDLPLITFLAVGEALFRKIDSDGDGTISQRELVNYWKGPTSPDAVEKTQALTSVQAVQASKQQTPAESSVRGGCKIPAPTPKAKVVVLSSYETEALSTATIGSQDQVVHAGRITVEPGTDPLYVVVSTYSALIWQFSGAVDRVERLVMSSHLTGPNEAQPDKPPLVGAIGVAEERISFLPVSGCFGYFSEIPSSESINALRDISKGLGREPDKVATAYSVLGFSIPSGKVSSAQAERNRATIQGNPRGIRIDGDASDTILQGAPSSARDDLYRFSPAGIADIDAKAVVSSRPTQPYEVLPQQAGLVQLLGSGVLKQNRSGEYIVQKPMRFPAGLYGAHSVTFLVPRGISTPAGDPGHSCVNSEDGSAQGATCR